MGVLALAPECSSYSDTVQPAWLIFTMKTYPQELIDAIIGRLNAPDTNTTVPLAFCLPVIALRNSFTEMAVCHRADLVPLPYREVGRHGETRTGPL